MEKTRLQYIDLTKAILSYLVILGHCIIFGNINEQYDVEQRSFLLKFIYSFHMPLFMLISGYFVGRGFSIKRFEAIKSRVRLLKPVFVIAIISAFLGSVNGFSIKLFILDLVKKFFLNYWFLWAVVWCSFVVGVINIISSDRWRYFWYILIIVLGLLFPDNYNLGGYKFMLPYMICGFEMGKQEKNLYRGKYKWLFFVLAAVCIFGYKAKYLIHESGVYLLALNETMLQHLFIDLYRWIAGFIVSYAILLLCDSLSKIMKKSQLELCSKVGKISMELYVIHVYFLSYVLIPISNRLGITYNIFICIIQSIIVFVISIISINILKKIHLYKFFFGK